MLPHLFKTLLLFTFSILIAWFYYSKFPFHIENFDGYTPYLVIILIIYGCIKYLQITFSREKTINYTPLNLFFYFCLHLFILSCLFFYFSEKEIGNGLVLFFKILFFSFLPISIIFISIAFGKKILNFLSQKFLNLNEVLVKQGKSFSFIVSLALGFFVFVFFVNHIVNLMIL